MSPTSSVKRALNEPSDVQRYWPAPYVRQARAPGLNNLMMLATRPLEECLILDTGSACFALSPVNAQAGDAAVRKNI